MKVGDVVWVFDPNRRVYAERSGPTAGPIWREHWVPYPVTGETRLSWVTNRGKVPKRPNDQGRRLIAQGDYPSLLVVLSEDEIEQERWKTANARRISDKVAKSDFATLKAVAELIRYKEPEQTA